MAVLKKRQKIILLALKDLGGVATTKQIAEKTGLHTNGVSQSLGALSYRRYVWYLGGTGGETKWKLKYSTLKVIQNKKNK